MRLTLRTLLAYLDDTLEPSQAKLIGQKVAESDTAQELIARIKQVTRRRRLTTPPPAGPGGKIDANTIAEYLDNAVTPEQLAEVEQICLSSDVHLAEVAACHQILTLVLGEPALVPPTAKQRMYALVKGPEAIPFRKPPVRRQPDREVIDESMETDETLRLGLPAYRRTGSWSQRLVLIGGGLVAACLLVFAIYQVLHPLERLKEKQTGPAVAQNTEKEPKPVEKPEPEPKSPKEPPAKVTPPEPEKVTPAPPEKGAEPDKKPPPKGAPETGPKPNPTPFPMAVPFEPPSPRVIAGLATYQPPTTNEKSILVQAQLPESAERQEWQRLGVRNADIKTARRLVSMPGSRSELDVRSGLQLTLWGYLPEYYPDPPVLESVVELYENKNLDLDLTLHRGRIVLINTRKGPVHVRIRVENPTNPESKDFFDVALQDRGAKLLVDRWSYFPLTERFYTDPKNPNRLGPVAQMALFGLAGEVYVKSNDNVMPLHAPPGGAATLHWLSAKGLLGTQQVDKLPETISTNPKLPPGIEKRFLRARADMLSARDALSTDLSNKAVEVALKEAVTSDVAARRRYAVRCFGALDDPGSILEALDQDSMTESSKSPPEIAVANAEVRGEAIKTLLAWIASSRDAEYKLYKLLTAKYTGKQAVTVMRLLHPTDFTPQARALPETYDTFIGYLNDDVLVIRELAAWHLYTLYHLMRPAATSSIPYAAVMDETLRRKAQDAWRALIAKELPAPK